jgi:hypothetical protein
MTDLELVTGYLIAWGDRKLKRAGKRERLPAALR